MLQNGSASEGPCRSRRRSMAQYATGARAQVPSDQIRILANIERISPALPGAGVGEEIPDAADGPDQGSVPAELLPQVADVHVEGPVEPRRAPPVEGDRQLVARDDPA